MAFRTSRRVCTLGRPGALGVGMWGSMQDHSSSERSVGYVFLIRARVANYHLTTPFRTVSEGSFSETHGFPAPSILGNWASGIVSSRLFLQSVEYGFELRKPGA